MGILVAKSLSRELEISHWGSALGITEYWELHNKGAALKNNLFSRVDYQWSQGSHHLSNVVKGLRINLPPRAAHVYYRDDIGNVSTSHFRREPQRSLLEIRPRYPIFGGWRYSWHHTFDVPLADYMRRDKGTGKFVFQVPFISSFVNVTVEDVTFKLVLPEGATDVEVHVPFDADKTEVQKYYTNLDSVGRTLITIQKSNVADEYGRPIQVSYNLTTAALLRKPLVVAGCVFGLFLLGMVLSRLDFSIVADPNAAARDKVEQLRLSVSKTYRKYLTVAVTLKAAFDTYRASKDLAVFKERRAPLEAQQAELVAALRAAAKAARVPAAASGTDGLPPSASAAALAAGADELAVKLGERGALLGVLHDAVTDFFTQADAAGGGVDEKRKAALTARLDTTEERAGKIDADVRGIAARLAL
ncbi:dolichyl-diphosphooligosaccharide--protein glycosyltransferase subunit 1 [Cladochytrium tenue]|nr:dolichyl-diphosphooligosaccharide--protein glycosyltransferase subunit 1 [Cladochytrium tenue]